MTQKRFFLWGVVYLIMAALFIMAAINEAHPTIWNATTLLFAAVAAFDIRMAIRFFSKNKK